MRSGLPGRMGIPSSVFAIALLTVPAIASGEPDILTVRLGPARMVAKGGRAPVLSPDGKQLLFAKRPNSDWYDEWWLAAADGSGARLVFRSAKDPNWSPDGTRIAFNRATGKIVIYDIAKKQEFEVFDNQRSDVNGPWWTADGKELVYKHAAMADPELNTPHLLELERLTVRTIRTERGEIEGNPGEIDWPEMPPSGAPAGFGLLCRTEAQPFSQRVAYTDGSLPKLGDPFGAAFQGLWASANDGRFVVRLSPSPCFQLSIRNGLVAIAVAEGVQVATLLTRPTSWNSRFVLPFGAEQEIVVGQHLVVYSKRVNPLNGAVVGLTEGNVKGGLEVVAVRPHECLAELVEWTGKPLKADDVAAGEFERVNNVFFQGGRVPARWSVIGSSLTPPQFEEWGGESGISAGIQKAADVKRAKELAILGTESFHSGDYDKAFALLSEALALDSENPTIGNNLGAVHIKRAMIHHGNGDRSRAIDEFKAACNLGFEASCRSAVRLESE